MMIFELKLLTKLAGFITILTTLNLIDQPISLKKTSLIKRFLNYQISIKNSNYLLKLYYNSKFLIF